MKPPLTIHEAAAQGNTPQVKRWLEADPSLLEAKDEQGMTPLHRAAAGWGDHVDTVSYLLACGADPNARDKDNWTPSDWAAFWLNVDVTALLEEKAALKLLLETLRNAGWSVTTKLDNSLDLNAVFLTRYPRIPDAYLTFLRHVVECCNPAQTAWFLCASDYTREDDTGFRWNEWECIGLDAAEGDQEIIAEITQFWDNHLPFMSAVHSEYAYLAISLSPAEYGAIVYGYGPEFEESVTKVCISFEEFLEMFGRSIFEKQAIPKELSDFL